MFIVLLMKVESIDTWMTYGGFLCEMEWNEITGIWIAAIKKNTKSKSTKLLFAQCSCLYVFMAVKYSILYTYIFFCDFFAISFVRRNLPWNSCTWVCIFFSLLESKEIKMKENIICFQVYFQRIEYQFDSV